MSAVLLLAAGLGVAALLSARRVHRVRGWPRVVAAVNHATPETRLVGGSGPMGAQVRYAVVARYAVAQVEYLARVHTAEAPGRRITLFYDPANPNDAVPGRPSLAWPALWALAALAALATWWRSP